MKRQNYDAEQRMVTSMGINHSISRKEHALNFPLDLILKI